MAVSPTPVREREAGREQRPDGGGEIRCVDCHHFAHFTCARCHAPVCLCHRTGAVGELCLCRECSPLAVRWAPLREALELVGLATLASVVVIHLLGYCTVSAILLFLMLMLVGTPLRLWQNRRREAARAAIAAVPPLAKARLLSRSGRSWCCQLPERLA